MPGLQKTTGDDDSVHLSGSQSLHDTLATIKEAADKKGHIDLFCDYDGVLVPIASRPQDAVLAEESRTLLRELSRHPSLHTSIVSGRSLADIRARVDVAGISYAGNHGLEIDGPGIHALQNIPANMREAVRSLAETLTQAMRSYPGVMVEDKMLVLALHFRLAEPQQIPRILETFSSLVNDANADGALRVTSGKSLVEVRPNVDCNKGTAVRRLLEERHGAQWQEQTLAVYLGDDETDEDAFRVLRDSGVTVRVGQEPEVQTAARNALRDIGDVRIFLEWILHIFPRP